MNNVWWQADRNRCSDEGGGGFVRGGLRNENGLRNALKYAYIKIYRAPCGRDDKFQGALGFNLFGVNMAEIKFYDCKSELQPRVD